MQKMPLEFYGELASLRGKFGDKEYSRDQLLPAVIGLIERHRKDASKHLLRDAANAILDSVEKQEDKPIAPGLFPYDAQVALGERQRIKRGRMNREQHLRFKRVIDRNKMAQDAAWAENSLWIDKGIDALENKPLDIVRENVLSESGELIKKKRA